MLQRKQGERVRTRRDSIRRTCVAPAACEHDQRDVGRHGRAALRLLGACRRPRHLEPRVHDCVRRQRRARCGGIGSHGICIGVATARRQKHDTCRLLGCVGGGDELCAGGVGDYRCGAARLQRVTHACCAERCVHGGDCEALAEAGMRREEPVGRGVCKQRNHAARLNAERAQACAKGGDLLRRALVRHPSVRPELAALHVVAAAVLRFPSVNRQHRAGAQHRPRGVACHCSVEQVRQRRASLEAGHTRHLSKAQLVSTRQLKARGGNYERGSDSDTRAQQRDERACRNAQARRRTSSGKSAWRRTSSSAVARTVTPNAAAAVASAARRDGAGSSMTRSRFQEARECSGRRDQGPPVQRSRRVLSWQADDTAIPANCTWVHLQRRTAAISHDMRRRLKPAAGAKETHVVSREQLHGAAPSEGSATAAAPTKLVWSTPCCAGAAPHSRWSLRWSR